MIAAVRIAIPLAALLLFLVQPLVAKVLLPALGGSPAVWATSLVFFQLALLAGYAYAHGLARLFGVRGQVVCHAVVVLSAMAVLPLDLTPPSGGAPGEAGPAVLFAWLLTRVGLPAVVLASTSPLLQLWAAVGGLVFPYRLYAISNAASLAGLLAYPFLVEPALAVRAQAVAWSGGVFLFGAASLYACFRMSRISANAAEPARDETPGHKLGEGLLWFALAGGGTWLLSAATNYLSQDVAAVPLLWVVPLTLYLLSHVLAFARPEPYPRAPWAVALGGLLAAATGLNLSGIDWSWILLAAVHSALLFVACRILHGELARRRPPVGDLTRFYFYTAAGGAAGGAFIALVAPFVFSEFVEYPLGLWLCYATLLALVAADRGSRLHGGKPWWAWAPLIISTWVLGMALAVPILPTAGEHSERSVFGVLRVRERELDSGRRVRELVHSGTVHGHVLVDVPEAEALGPTSYYGADTGIGLALREIGERRAGRGIHVGITGLGIGGLAGYAREGDHFRFYELDPLVVEVARAHFPYLADSPGERSIVVGDGRLAIAAEVERGGERPFDLLALDAFSADSVPGHLITKEAFEVYWQRLAPDGLLLVHVSNRYLDLVPVIRASAAATEAHWIEIRSEGDDARALYPTHWVLVSRSPHLLEQPVFASREPEPENPRFLHWTDDYSDLLGAIR